MINGEWPGVRALVLMVLNDVNTMKTHHELHGDMDGHTCLLNTCPIHYPDAYADAVASRVAMAVAREAAPAKVPSVNLKYGPL